MVTKKHSEKFAQINFKLIGEEALELHRRWLMLAGAMGKAGAKVYLFKKGMEAVLEEYPEPKGPKFEKMLVEFNQYLKDIRLETKGTQ